MLVFCRLFLTNVGPTTSFQILDVTIKKPKIRGQVQVQPSREAHALVEHMGARLAVPFDCRFTIRPPVVKSGEIFTCDIVLKDQFGEEHVAKKVPFTTVGMPVWETMHERWKAEREAADRTQKQIHQTIKEVQDITCRSDAEG